MLCKLCDTENPATNHFCGNCGAALISVAKPVPVDDPVLAPPEPIPDFRSPDLQPSDAPATDLHTKDLHPNDVLITEPFSPVTHAPVPHRRERYIPISGSSFLGLNEPSDDDEPDSPPPVPPVRHSPEAPRKEARASSHRNAASSFLGLTETNDEPYSDPVVYRTDAHRDRQTTISGPSFLGLTDTSATDSTDYLLEDDNPRASRTGWIIFSIVAIAILSVIGFAEWRTITTGHLTIPGLKSSTAEGPQILPEASSNAQPAIAPPTAPGAPPDTTNPASTSTTGEPTFESETQKKPMVPTPPPPREAVGQQATTAESASPPAMAAPTDAPTAKPAEPPAAEKTPATEPPKETKPEPVKTRASRAPIPEKAPDPRQNKMLVTGENYLYGRAGLPQNCQQAVVYLKAAADSENAPAMSHLGAMYASGHCVQANRVAAYKWFVRASEVDPRNQWTSRNLNMIWREMTPQERAAISH